MPVSFHHLLARSLELGASDLHLKAGRPPGLRIHGALRPLEDAPPLTAEDTMAFAREILNPAQARKLDNHAEIDLAYEVPGLARFRVNTFRQRGQTGMVLRVIPEKIPAFEELLLPDILNRICEERRGLVLVTGTTGSGKSTTLAAMVDYINASRPEHIITIEDPIEYLHRDKRSYVNQREVDVDTGSFASALRAALREDPDVILVGEMRDLETITIALLAAETGHLVLSTLHTLDAPETIQRIIAVFPPAEQQLIRHQLASTLKAVISQRLLPRSDGRGRIPAVEVLISTAYIRESITTPEKTALIRDAIASGASQYGMQTFDQSLYDILRKNLITYDDALASATNPGEFKMRVQGVRSTGDLAREDMERAATAPTIERFPRR